MLGSILLVLSSQCPLIAQAPTMPDEVSYIQGDSLMAYNIPYFPLKISTLGDLMEMDSKEYLIRQKYPEMTDLLSCIWGKESTYGLDKRRGDHGLAYGDFQIHIDKHPVSEFCALTFECALDYTAKSIQEGNGWWWSSYRKCGGK